MYSLLTTEPIRKFQKELGISEEFIEGANTPAFARNTVQGSLKAFLLMVRTLPTPCLS